MDFQEVAFEDDIIKIPYNFKRDREWFKDFVFLNQDNNKSLSEDDKIDKDDPGDYFMIKNIAFLFADMGYFDYNKDKKIDELWDKQETNIKKRIKIINKCLDVYDIIFPYTHRKPILGNDELQFVHKLMDRLFYDTCYPIADERGIDLNMELDLPGWLDLKKVLLRFFSKINFDREYMLFEEEVEGTGHVRPLYRTDGTSLKGTGVFSLNFIGKEEEDKYQ